MSAVKMQICFSFCNLSNSELILTYDGFRPEELRPESQLVLLAKLAANQPEPIWPLIVQLTLR